MRTHELYRDNTFTVFMKPVDIKVVGMDRAPEYAMIPTNALIEEMSKRTRAYILEELANGGGVRVIVGNDGKGRITLKVHFIGRDQQSLLGPEPFAIQLAR